MKTYTISEVVFYEVKANSEEEAEKKFLEAEDVNKFFDHVEDREVYLAHQDRPTCEHCGKSYDDAGDGWCGACPDCADRAAHK